MNSAVLNPLLTTREALATLVLLFATAEVQTSDAHETRMRFRDDAETAADELDAMLEAARPVTPANVRSIWKAVVRLRARWSTSYEAHKPCPILYDPVLNREMPARVADWTQEVTVTLDEAVRSLHGAVVATMTGGAPAASAPRSAAALDGRPPAEAPRPTPTRSGSSRAAPPRARPGRARVAQRKE